MSGKGFIKGFIDIYQELWQDIDQSKSKDEIENYKIALKCLKSVVEDLKQLEDLDDCGIEKFKSIVEKYVERETELD